MTISRSPEPGSKPRYQAIADDMAQAIVNGQFGPGEKLVDALTDIKMLHASATAPMCAICRHNDRSLPATVRLPLR